VTPWTGFWTRNYFAHHWPAIGTVMFNPYVCGAVTGLGVVTMLAGMRELIASFSARRTSVDAPVDGARP
jgi:hypothetical protein